ncbi:MAG TPA: CopG family transcriptional regulator [Rhizomicrobium sp.]
MSHARFAPITASLLARKGGAMPSSMMPPALQPPFVPAAVVPAPRPAVQQAQPEIEQDHDGAQSHDPSRPKKLFIALSHREHERLAIAAVKTGLSRHQLVRDALESYFEQLSRDMREGCACMSGAKSCSGSCEA